MRERKKSITETDAAVAISNIVNNTKFFVNDSLNYTKENTMIVDNIESLGSQIKKVLNKGRQDATKIVNRARRFARNAVDFTDFADEDSVSTYDYQLLLSIIGAQEKEINQGSKHKVMYNLPANEKLVYKARVKKGSIKFSLVFSASDDIRSSIPPQVYTSEQEIQGTIEATDYNRMVSLVFEPVGAALNSRHVGYWVSIGPNVSLADDGVGASRTKEVIAAEEGPKFNF